MSTTRAEDARQPAIAGQAVVTIFHWVTFVRKDHGEPRRTKHGDRATRLEVSSKTQMRELLPALSQMLGAHVLHIETEDGLVLDDLRQLDADSGRRQVLYAIVDVPKKDGVQCTVM